MKQRLFTIPTILIALVIATSCSRKSKQAEEQITVEHTENNAPAGDSTLNSLSGNVTMKQVSSFPNTVILTGLAQHRLISVYKSRKQAGQETFSSRSSYNEEENGETNEHFMPGLDILYGYNLLNIAHYDMTREKCNFLFSQPVLVKTLYYPSFVQDSVDKMPVNRGYYLVSVYDEDTNKDTLINKKDLRRFYCFDSTGTNRIQIIPADYSAIRSEYDPKNDVMYVFAKQDENKNGIQDKSEQMHVFWFSLKTPHKAKLLY